MNANLRKPDKSKQGRSTRDWLVDRVLWGVIWGLRRLPYTQRVQFCGWMMGSVMGPALGFRRKARANLEYVFPNWPAARKDQIAKDACNNAGRTFIENYSSQEFINRCAKGVVTGEGLAILQQARADGKPVILATGHFGNFHAMRSALVSQGFKIGSLYRPMNNLYFNDHYVKTLREVGEPMFPRGKEGFRDLISHMRKGGILAVAHDQYMYEGAELEFMGKIATTALSAAELAIKYDAVLLPCYGTRKFDGLNFDIEIEGPVPMGSAEEMMQSLNDSLEARVRKNPGQWFWLHRRWKPHRDAYRAAAKIGP